MKTPIITIILAIFTTGLMAGIFFTWSNAVKPGLGRLDDFGYLSAFQSMNRVILNPAFQGLFMAAVILPILAAYFSYQHSTGFVFGLICTSAGLYLAGVFGVTFLGNIPLNNLVDATALDQLSTDEFSKLRSSVEARWNMLNWVRTGSSVVVFALLLWAGFKLALLMD